LGSGAYNQEKLEERRRSEFEPMIDYKYPTIASGLLPSGALSAHPIEDETINSEDEENLPCIL
jgi:hypothetical protein